MRKPKFKINQWVWTISRRRIDVITKRCSHRNGKGYIVYKGIRYSCSRCSGGIIMKEVMEWKVRGPRKVFGISIHIDKHKRGNGIEESHIYRIGRFRTHWLECYVFGSRKEALAEAKKLNEIEGKNETRI